MTLPAPGKRDCPGNLQQPPSGSTPERIIMRIIGKLTGPGAVLAIAVAATAMTAPWPAQAQNAAGAKAALTVLPFSFFDTPAGRRDQKPQHAARLAAVGEQL